MVSSDFCCLFVSLCVGWFVCLFVVFFNGNIVGFLGHCQTETRAVFSEKHPLSAPSSPNDNPTVISSLKNKIK